MTKMNKQQHTDIATELNDPIVERKNCRISGKVFAIYQSDLSFYKKISPLLGTVRYAIPSPNLCPEERMRRRMCFRNFFSLYKRDSSLSHRPMISMYHKNVPFPVYSIQEWWSDERDALSYQRKIDFSRPVFEQFFELVNAVPKMNVFNVNSDNSNYSNASVENKNCYLMFGAVNNEDCCYGHIVRHCRDCYDCLYCYHSEQCYQCIDCNNSYKVFYSQETENCSESSYLFQCDHCSFCFGCVGLKNKSYCLFNKQLDKKSYLSAIHQIKNNKEFIMEALAKLKKKASIHRFSGQLCENVLGNFLYHCNQTHFVHDLKHCDNLKYCATIENFQYCYDSNYAAIVGQRFYETLTCRGHNILFSYDCFHDGSYLLYCDNCYGCHHCFLCSGLKQKSYCILNIQYSKDEYEKIAAHIICHMQDTGEWGEFFDPIYSPFAYNESIASSYYPCSDEQIFSEGKRLQKDSYPLNIPSSLELIKASTLSASIDEITDDIINKGIICEVSGKPFRIVKSELAFYRRHGITLPHEHPEIRQEERLKKRPGRDQLFRVE